MPDEEGRENKKKSKRREKDAESSLPFWVSLCLGNHTERCLYNSTPTTTGSLAYPETEKENGVWCQKTYSNDGSVVPGTPTLSPNTFS